jgi:hypothetical protein
MVWKQRDDNLSTAISMAAAIIFSKKKKGKMQRIDVGSNMLEGTSPDRLPKTAKNMINKYKSTH